MTIKGEIIILLVTTCLDMLMFLKCHELSRTWKFIKNEKSSFSFCLLSFIDQSKMKSTRARLLLCSIESMWISFTRVDWKQTKKIQSRELLTWQESFLFQSTGRVILLLKHFFVFIKWQGKKSLVHEHRRLTFITTHRRVSNIKIIHWWDVYVGCCECYWSCVRVRETRKKAPKKKKWERERTHNALIDECYSSWRDSIGWNKWEKNPHYQHQSNWRFLALMQVLLFNVLISLFAF